MEPITRDAANDFFKSKYAPLETILPAIKDPLKQAGLVFTQVPNGANGLKTLIIDVASGEFIEGVCEMTPAKNDPQGQGSAMTYMRRYSLVAMLGLNTDEDDDGNAASSVAKNPPPARPAHVQRPRATPQEQPPTRPEVPPRTPPQWAPPRLKPPIINQQPNV